jgi:iron complex outermembrane receptor protein
MRFEMKRTRSAVAQALCAGVAGAMLAMPSAAQQAPREKIEVTGSNIKRVDVEGPSPILVLSRDDIDRSGATNAFELMNLVAANNSAGNVSFASTIGSLTFSANTASLRGLQGGRTLVLLNGKRLSSFSGEIQGVSGVNLSTIPLNAIERIEVLLDGASAIYGSDAIAGVINFIVRKDYVGAEVSAYYGAPTRSGSGGEQTTLKGAFGFGDLTKDRYNVFVAAQFDKQDPLEQRTRNFSNSSVNLDMGLVGISGTTFPAFVVTGGIGNPAFPNCAPSHYYPGLGERCFYDPAEQAGVQSIPALETKNVFGAATFQFTPNLQGYVTGNYMQSENNFVIQPVPIADVFGDPITLQPTSPFYPTAAAIASGVNGQPLNVRWRAVENGNRDTTDTNDQWQVVGGLKGNFGAWDWDASVTYNEGTTEQVLNGGFPLRSLIVPLLNSGRVNMFGPNTPAISDEVRATNFVGKVFDGKSSATYVDAKMSGEIFNLPAGPVGAAFGAQMGGQEFEQTPSAVLASGDLSGYGGNVLPVNQDRDTWAVFGEVNVPIVKNLELNLAVRHDDYSDFGSTTNPKVGLRFTPTREVLLRGSYGTGFLAPTLYQLWTPNIQGTSATGLSDPLRCPTTNDTLDCITQFQVTFGGNANLDPETSKQYTLGMVFEPRRGTSVSIDWFDMILEDVIVNGITPAVVLADLNQYGNLVTRAAPDAQFPTLPGRIINIDQRFINLGTVKIQGVDVNLQHAFEPTPYGRFRAQLSGTYYHKYDVEQVDGSYLSAVSNTFGSAVTGVSPRWKSYQSVTWDQGPWSVTLGNSYQSAYRDFQFDGNGDFRTVSSMSLWDLYVNWKGIKNLSLTLGAKNLLDANPPQTNQQNSFQAGYDPSYYDPRARVVYVSATYSFK